MFNLTFFLTWVLLACYSAVSAEEGDGSDPESSHVVVLTQENFESFVTGNKAALVEFYAPWCGHCKRLAPEYEKAAETLKEEGIPLAKVDATEEDVLAREYGVRGYPTLKFFRNGKAEEYKGGRTADAIVQWVQKMSGPAVEEAADLAKAETLAAEADVSFIGAFKSADSPAAKTFAEVADANRLLGKFISYTDSKASDEVLIRRKNEEVDTKVPVTADNKEDIVKILSTERFPYFGPISGDNYSDYFSAEAELVWLAAETKTYTEVGEVIRTAAKQLRPKYMFVWLDTEKFADHATQALGVKEFPAVVLQTKAARFLFPKSEGYTADDLVKFMKEVEDGKVERSLMSEPIPDTNDEAVKVVVGKNFNDIVMNPDTDVLLEVYATWCGHCKKFEPLYREFAEAVAANKHLVVAKMDGTANESPVETFEWRGFPTVFWVKAGADKKPVLYEGPRSVEGLMEFVKENSSKPVVTADNVDGKDEL